MKRRTLKTISYIAVIAVIVSASLWIFGTLSRTMGCEFTDNAQIRRQIVPVNSRVQGYIKEIRFEEYQPVSKGDTLFIIDDSDLRLRVARARAEYANALAMRDVASRSVGVASDNVAVSRASVEEARVVMENAHTDLARYKQLLDRDAATRQQYDAANTAYLTAKARYETLLRQHSASSSVEAETRGRIAASEAGVELARAMLEIAELDLSYTAVLAPCNGYASRKAIQTGQLVQPGQQLLDIVDSDCVWVDANYKETQTARIRVGADADIHVDAIPDVVFHGKVVSMSRATGASLSLLPQDNSSGNFVKVRGRIPVRIEFTDDNPSEALSRLGAGMNVECRVRF